MSTETSERPAVPRMHAEAGFAPDEIQTPVRFSGFLCLLLGALSILSLLGRPLLLIPLAAVVAGLIALRPAPEGRPVGTRAAQLGLLLAVGFGSCGFFLPWAQTRTLGSQSAYFTREYFELLEKGEWELVAELQRQPRARHLESMPLKQFYSVNEKAREAVEQLRSDATLQAIAQAGDRADWQVVESPRVYTRWGHLLVNTVWQDRAGVVDENIRVEMEYTVDPEADVGQWHVTAVYFDRERLVAESIL